MTDDYKGVYSFARMWDLVDTMINWDFPKELTRYRAAFSDEMISAELLMAIFWEETKFQNIGQEPAGPAIGFGQVEEATRKRTLHYFNNEDDNGRSLGEPRIPGGLKESEWTKKTIVEDEHKSVMLPMLLLTHLWEVKSKSLMGLLRIYAGYDEVPKAAPQFLEPRLKAAGGTSRRPGIISDSRSSTAGWPVAMSSGARPSAGSRRSSRSEATKR